MGFRDFVRLARELITSAPPQDIPHDLMRHADELAARAEKLLATTKPLLGAGSFLADVSDEPASHEAIQRKIEKIYGVQQTDTGVIFTARAPGANDVRVAGDFNGWSPEAAPMCQLDDGDFQAVLPLTPGRYRYRLVVDGQWAQDPFNPQVESNPYGEFDSIVEVA
jgi:chromosome partitioning protein